MKYILPEQFLVKLLRLRADYEKREKIILNGAVQPYSISLFFGATDVESRNRQLCLIEKMLIALMNDIIPSPENGFNQQKSLTALQVLVTLCFYTKSQINSKYTLSGNSSTLWQLIDEAMALTDPKLNVMDPETHACCLLATERYLKSEHCLESINACLKKQVTAKEWRDFSNFVAGECKLLDQKYVTTTYPITSVMMPLVAKPCEFAGYTLGWVFGNWFGKSASLLSTHTAVTATLGGGLVFLFGPSATLGVILITPTIAGQLIETYCGISLAFIMGNSMNLIGKGVGFTVGMSLDLSTQLLCKTCSLIANYQDKSANSKLTGISLIDGTSIIEGIPLELAHINQLPKEQDLQSIPVITAIEENQLIVKFRGVTKKIAIAADAQETIGELKKMGLQQKQPELEVEAEHGTIIGLS